MVIAVFASLEGESLEDFSIRLAQQWRIGQKGLDNGVILLLFARDRKLRFEVGYGLEPIIPDAFAGRVIREVVAPRFREGRYAAGLEGAVNAVFSRIAAAKGTAGPQARERRPQPWLTPFSAAGVIALAWIIILAFVAAALLSPAGRARRKAYTAGRGGWLTGLPIVMGGGGGWGGGFGGGGGFSGGGGDFGGGGASGEW